MPSQDDKTNRRRTRASKAILGDFVVKFEDVMDALRDTINDILFANGLGVREYGTILMHDATAKSLKDYYLAFIRMHHEDKLKHEATEKYLSLLINKINDALELRNTVLHSTWNFLPDKENHMKDRFLGFRFKVNKAKGMYNYFDRLPNKTEFLTFNKSLKLLAFAIKHAEWNIRNKINIDLGNIDLDKITFKWEGTEWKYGHLSPLT